MAQDAKLDGNLITDTRPLAVEAQVNSGVDIGDVTVNNDVGAAAVNIQDGGNSITVDGTATITANGDTIQVSPTVTAGIYAANDVVGEQMTFANAALVAGGGGVIKSCQIIDDAGQDVVLELWLFNQAFTVIADNAPWAPSQADLRNLVCVISSNDGTWYAAGTPSVCDIEVSERYDAAATSLFGQLVTRGTPTFNAVDDVSVQIGVLQD